MVNGRPSSVHVTVVAGEPVVVQIRVRDEFEVIATTFGGAAWKNKPLSSKELDVITIYNGL